MALLALLGSAPPATAGWLTFPGGFAPPGSPPHELARSHPAAPVPARVLSVRFTHEQFRHSRRALAAADPATSALAGVRVAHEAVELGYGLGSGLSGRARIGWGSFDPDRGNLVPAGSDGSQASRRQAAWEDIAVAVGGTASFLDGHLSARLEGGMILGSGGDQAYTNGSGLALSPFTLGESAPFGGVAATLALARAAAPVAVHLHAECSLVDRRDPPAGMASAPFPNRLPLVVLGPEAHDALDLRFALSFSHPGAVLFAEMDLPLLRGAHDLIAPREVPLTVTPGFALRLGVLEFGAQLDLTVAANDAGTSFDPHLSYPDWGLRLRFGTDLVPFDRDRDGDGLGDRTDRCPNEPEDRDRYADQDGCPDPDNDGDSIIDLIDSCPQVPEDRDGFADEDGCPETDNDGDGIDDAIDLCPSSAEDMDGVADEDGCPELDPERGAAAEPDSVPRSESTPPPEETP